MGLFPLREIPDLERGIGELDAALPEYEKAELYYKGNSPDVWLDPVILRLLGGIPYKINFARVPVTTLAARMIIGSVTVNDEDDASERLEEIWKANEMHIESKGLITGVLKYGDYYLEVWPDKNGDPRLVGCDPTCARMIYSREDKRTPLFLVKRWPMGKKVVRADLRYADRIEKYISDDDGKTWDYFIPETEEELEDLGLSDDEEEDADAQWPMDNPFGEIPAFHLRTDRPYGHPVHEEAWGAADAITKIAQAHLGTADYLGMSQRVALLDPEDPRGSGTLSDFDDDRPGSVGGGGAGAGIVDVGGMSTTPGELWALRAKSVAEFKPADGTSFIESMKFYIGVAAQLTQIPLRFFADPQGQHPSGFSLRTADTPMRLLVGDILDQLSASLQRALAFALVIDGEEKAEPGELDAIPVIVKWKQAEVSDSNDEWQAAVEKLKAGVPQRQVFLDMGYTAEQCDSWGLTEEDAQATHPQLFSGGSGVIAAAEVLNDPELTTPQGIDPKDQPKPVPPPTPVIAGPGAPGAPGQPVIAPPPGSHGPNPLNPRAPKKATGQPQPGNEGNANAQNQP